MAITRVGGSWIHKYVSLVADDVTHTYTRAAKPELNLPNGSRCFEMDSDTEYIYDRENDAWEVYVPSSGGGGTTNYSQLSNKPSINNVELSGNKTLAALGINAGSIGFDETETYDDGSVGKEVSDVKNAISQNTEAISELDGVAYSVGDSLKVGRSLNGYMLNSNGYLASSSGYNVSFYRVIPGEIIYLKLSQDTDTVYNFQTTDANPTASSGNIVENVHSAVDGFVKVPDGANFIAVCKLTTNTTNAICSTITSRTGIMEEVNTLFDVQEIVYASADLTTSSYVIGGTYDNKISFSYIPVTDAGLLKVTWRDNRNNASATTDLTFVVCKYLGSSYQIVATFSAPSIAGRTNVYQSDYYVDGNDTYYVGFYGMHPSNMSLYSYGWFMSSQTFASKDDLTIGTTFTRGSNYTNQSFAMYPSVISTNQGMREEIAEINDKISGNMAKEDEKYAHFSIDDCLFWINLIDNEATYNSAFEEPHLALYKSIHELYGLCITLNVFCTSGDYSISDVPSKFATEFKANSNWLKFAYHAEDENTYLSNLTALEATESYNKFASAIYTMTGTTDCIDRVTRLGFYDGNLENCLAIRDANCGIVGLLCADDTRNSYYLGETLSAYVRNHAMYRDATNQLVFITTIRRLEYYTVADAAELLTVAKGNINRYLEFFTHESSSDRLSAMVAWCVTNGYKFGFMQEILRI